MSRLRDQMNIIEESSDMEMLVGSVKDTGGVYFVTAFSGLLAPYWDRDAVSLFLRQYMCAARLTCRLVPSSV
jgi:glycerol kinase